MKKKSSARTSRFLCHPGVKIPDTKPKSETPEIETRNPYPELSYIHDANYTRPDFVQLVFVYRFAMQPKMVIKLSPNDRRKFKHTKVGLILHHVIRGFSRS